MSDTVTTLSLVTLAQMYRGDVVRQINRRVVLLKMIKVVAGEGKNLAWAPEADGALAENYSEGADAANFGGDAQASAILTWGLYRANMHVTNLALDGASSSVDPTGNLQLWARQIVNGSAKLASIINKDCYSGAGSGTLLFGLDGAIGSNSNTYATIDRSSNSYFQPTVIDPGTDTAVTFAGIRDDIRQIYEACGENPDLGLCSPSLFNSIGALFDATRRQIQDVVTARGPIKLDFGYQALEVDGTVFVKDKDATAKSLYYLNTEHVELQYLPSAEQRMLMEAAEMEVEADDGFGQVPLGFKYEKLAKTGASEKAEVLWTGQLKVDRPNACGVRKHAI